MKKIKPGLIKEAVEHLREGGLIIYPTETAYGLGADATNYRAVARIFKIKKRSLKKSLPVIVHSMQAATELVQFSETARKLAKKYWPGSLTLILPIQIGARLALRVKQNCTVALRVSSNSVAKALAQGLGGPIISTSANLSGQGECYSIVTIKKQFRKIPEDLLIIDAGILPKRKTSTIVLVKNDKIKILRPGSIKL